MEGVHNSLSLMYQKIDATLDKLFACVIAVAFSAMVVLVFAEVCVRYVTGGSMTWSGEAARFLFIWMVFLGSSVAMRKGSHIAVLNLVQWLPPFWSNVVVCIGDILLLSFFTMVVRGSFDVLPVTAIQKSPAMQLPMVVVYLAVPLSCFFSGIEVVKDLVLRIKRAVGLAAKGGTQS